MKQKLILLVLFVLMFASAARADELELYVFNKPFPGAIWMNHSTLYAEADPLLKLLKVQLKNISDKNITLVHDGKESILASAKKNGVLFVGVKEVAAATGLAFTYNPQTKIVDLFAPKQGLPEGPSTKSPRAQGTASKYDVEVIHTEEEKGIDEFAVIVTVENDGPPAPVVKVTCQFTDEDHKPLEAQTQTIANMDAGAKASVPFKMVYPKASNAGSYRDYYTKIKYDISISYQ